MHGHSIAEVTSVDLIVETLHERCKWLHQMLRDEVRGLTQEQLDYVPAPEANSIGVLVTHILGSEAEFWHLVAGATVQRDRAAEFASRGRTAAELLAQIDAADRMLDELAPQIGHDALAKVWQRANGDARTGAYWLINSFSHGREHLGHLQLTKQLRPEHFPAPAHPY